ncbi:MAG: hypothetical protein JF607_17470 [Burkholderiales bacterium]|jgi:hypothetical protein|nr:hypothetical protein [Burkholderiales bacterium]
MLQDLNCLFSGAVGSDGTRTAQAVTATALSTNIVDTRIAALPALQDAGIGGSMLYLVVCVKDAFNTLTSLTITLETDSTSNLATSPTTHLTFSVLLAALTAGAVVACAPLPSGQFERYMAVRFTVVGSNPTLGSVIAYLTDTPPAWQAYPKNFTVDV